MPGAHEGDFEIFATPDVHERVHQTQAAWTLVAKGSHSGPGGMEHRVQLQRDVIIPEGARHAFYIAGDSTNSVRFSTDTDSAKSGENEEVIIHLGHFKSYPWESQLSTGPHGHNGMQAFLGSLEYYVLQTRRVEHAETMATEMWRRRPFPDAQVVAQCGKTFAVHRAVLAASSHVLEAAWRQPLRESEERLLRIDADADIVEALLCFMYTGQESVSCDPGEILSLAHLYGLHALVQGSATRLVTQVTASNALTAVRALRPYRNDAAVSSAWQSLLLSIQGILDKDVGLMEEVLLTA